MNDQAKLEADLKRTLLNDPKFQAETAQIREALAEMGEKGERVFKGIQHVANDILDGVRRDCDTAERAIRQEAMTRPEFMIMQMLDPKGVTAFIDGAMAGIAMVRALVTTRKVSMAQVAPNGEAAGS